MKAGRDINIGVNDSYLDNLKNKELLKKQQDSKLILGEVLKKKIKLSVICVVIAFIIFLFCYFLFPDLILKYGSMENFVTRTVIDVFKDGKVKMLVSLIFPVLFLLKVLPSVWETSRIERKHKKLIEQIDVILKEREYLKNKTFE